MLICIAAGRVGRIGGIVRDLKIRPGQRLGTCASTVFAKTVRPFWEKLANAVLKAASTSAAVAFASIKRRLSETARFWKP